MDKKLLKAKQELQKYTNIWIVIAICTIAILFIPYLQLQQRLPNPTLDRQPGLREP